MKSADLVFKAVSHPTRRAILSLLAASTRSVKELTAEFEMSQPAISQHLKELRNASLVASERVGLEQRYRLTPEPLKHVLDWSVQYRTLIDPFAHRWSLLAREEPTGNSEPVEKKRNGG
jgi:DNA-binding transcriptional ArsR family regulator